MTQQDLPSTARRIWKSAQLLIAFKRDRDRSTRAVPRLWPPKGGIAYLRGRSPDQETFIDVKGHSDEDSVQLKLRSDRIIARRNSNAGWSGVELDDGQVRVLVGDVWIEIGDDGGVTRRTADSTTYLEGDGSFIRVSDDLEVTVDADGRQMTRRTSEQFDGIFPDGVISRKKNGPSG